MQRLSELAKTVNISMSSFYNACTELISAHGEAEVMEILNLISRDDGAPFVQFFLEGGMLRPKPKSDMDELLDHTKAILHPGLQGYIPGELCEPLFANKAFCAECTVDENGELDAIIANPDNACDYFPTFVDKPHVILRGRKTWVVSVEEECAAEAQEMVSEEDAKKYWLYREDLPNGLKRKYLLSTKIQGKFSTKTIPRFLVPEGTVRDGQYYKVTDNEDFQKFGYPGNHTALREHLESQVKAKEHVPAEGPLLDYDEFWNSSVASKFKDPMQFSFVTLINDMLPEATAAYWKSNPKQATRLRSTILKIRLGKSAHQLYTNVYNMVPDGMKGYAHQIYTAVVFSAMSQFNYNRNSDRFESSAADTR